MAVLRNWSTASAVRPRLQKRQAQVVLGNGRDRGGGAVQSGAVQSPRTNARPLAGRRPAWSGTPASSGLMRTASSNSGTAHCGSKRASRSTPRFKRADESSLYLSTRCCMMASSTTRRLSSGPARQDLQPQMGHLVVGVIACRHANGRMIRIPRVGHRVVVVVAHRNHRALWKKDGLSIAKDALPAQVPVGNFEEPLALAAGERRVDLHQPGPGSGRGGTGRADRHRGAA